MNFASPRFRGLIACVLFCALFSVKLFGCTRSLASVKVPPSFRVSVWHDAKAVPGITVEIYKDAESENQKPLLALLTDRDGSAEARDLATGVYVISTAGPGQGSGVYAVVATNHPKPSSEIKLEWPYLPEGILKSRTLVGDLVSNDPWHPFENIHLELWAAGSFRPLAVADTGADGHFHFDESRAGIYVLRVRGHQKDLAPDHQTEGDVAIELAPSAPDSIEISLRLDMTTCGIHYGGNCTSSGDRPLATAARRLQVLYTPGMAEYPMIAGARYKLLNDHGVSIAEGITDKNGRAELPSDATGRTTLVVASPLLTTLQQTLDLLAPVPGAPDLAVTLRQLDECSTVTLENHAP
jgi:hypothetical protein